MNQPARNRFRVDITSNTGTVPAGMNTIKYIGNSRPHAERAYHSICTLQPDKPVLLSEWNEASSAYIALESRSVS